MNNRDFRRGPTSRTVETTGKTLEEAVQAAMRRLHARRDEIELEVLEEGRGGFLGIGAKEAKIRARLRPEQQEIARPLRGGRQFPSRRPWQGEAGRAGEEQGTRRAGNERPGRRSSSRGRTGAGRGTTDAGPTGAGQAQGRAARSEPQTPSEPRTRRGRSDDRTPLRFGGARRQERPRAPEAAPEGSAVEPSGADQLRDVALEESIVGYARGLLERMGFPVGVQVQFADGAYEVRIDGGNSDAVLIGRRGETLEALQHVLAKMASRGREELVHVRVDVSHYRERRDERLVERALEIAGQVRRTGREVVTEPLSAAERRIIHRTLSETGDIMTHALGEGLVKRVWIGPAGRPVPEAAEVEGTSQEIRSEAPTAYQAPVTPAEAEEPERPEVSDRSEDADHLSWMDTERPEVERDNAAPEWGRRPKPAKGRRAR